MRLPRSQAQHTTLLFGAFTAGCHSWQTLRATWRTRYSPTNASVSRASGQAVDLTPLPVQILGYWAAQACNAWGSSAQLAKEVGQLQQAGCSACVEVAAGGSGGLSRLHCLRHTFLSYNMTGAPAFLAAVARWHLLKHVWSRATPLLPGNHLHGTQG